VFAAALSTMAPSTRAETVSSAEPLDLEWNAPADCPGRDTVIEEIRRAGRWHVRIVTLGESGGERAFDSASCSALTRATALVLAIRLKPTRFASKDLRAGAARASVPAPVIPPPPPPTPLAPLSMPIPVRTAGIVVAAGAITEAMAPAAVPTPERPSPERPPFRVPGSFIVGVSAIVSTGDLPAATQAQSSISPMCSDTCASSCMARQGWYSRCRPRRFTPRPRHLGRDTKRRVGGRVSGASQCVHEQHRVRLALGRRNVVPREHSSYFGCHRRHRVLLDMG